MTSDERIQRSVFKKEATAYVPNSINLVDLVFQHDADLIMIELIACVAYSATCSSRSSMPRRNRAATVVNLLLDDSGHNTKSYGTHSA